MAESKIDIVAPLIEHNQQLIEELKLECTTPQLALFDRCYPNGVPDNDADVRNAVRLLQRTVLKNRESKEN